VELEDGARLEYDGETMKRTNLQRVFFWNRNPGVFVNKQSGQQIRLEGISIGPKFTGSVREWYETLVETVIDMRNHLEKDAGCKADRVFVRCDADTLCFFEASILYKPTENGRGELCQMIVEEDRDQNRFQIQVEIEYKLGGRTQMKQGRVHILED